MNLNVFSVRHTDKVATIPTHFINRVALITCHLCILLIPVLLCVPHTDQAMLYAENTVVLTRMALDSAQWTETMMAAPLASLGTSLQTTVRLQRGAAGGSAAVARPASTGLGTQQATT